MSIEHKAFLFNYDGFELHLSSILMDSLTNEDTSNLVAFIKQNLASLKDPYEGEPLNNSWETMIDNADPHQYGDFALTMYYNPQHDIGLGYNWEDSHNFLCQKFIDKPLILLGVPFGSINNYFDPGKMGAYFQSPHQVQENLRLLEEITYQSS